MPSLYVDLSAHHARNLGQFERQRTILTTNSFDLAHPTEICNHRGSTSQLVSNSILCPPIAPSTAPTDKIGSFDSNRGPTVPSICACFMFYLIVPPRSVRQLLRKRHGGRKDDLSRALGHGWTGGL